MALELVSDIKAETTLFDVIGTPEPRAGTYFTLDDETILCLGGGQSRPEEPFVEETEIIWQVQALRGVLDTTAAAHVASTAMTVAGLGTGGGAILTATVDLSAADIATLNSVPVEVVPAPGAGKASVVVSATLHLTIVEPFGGGIAAGLQLLYEGFDAAFGFLSAAPVQSAGDQLLFFVPILSNFDTPSDVPVLLYSEDDAADYGALVAVVITDPGTGYAPGDTGTVNAGNGDATYEVDTVGGGGSVTALHIVDGGSGIKVDAEPVATVTDTGAGEGLIVTVTEVDAQIGDGTARITVAYFVMDLS